MTLILHGLRASIRPGAIHGIVATVTGSVLGGGPDSHATEKFAERFVKAGLLDRGPDGALPSAG
ncbi:MAG TPA: hypothetical protein VGD51_04570, partial [Nocardioidaceae bacterium]